MFRCESNLVIYEIYQLCLFVDPSTAKCSKYIQMSERGGVKLDGSNFRNKPSTAITMTAWVNAYSLSDKGSVQQIFIANDGKQRGMNSSLRNVLI